MAAQGGNPVGIGVIGAGKMGRIHAANLSRGIPNARLVAVADVVEDSAKKLAAEFGVSNVFTDYLRLVENREVQAIVIATPTLLKPQVVKFACEAGKHIFCEKPIATTFHEAEQVLKSSQKSPGKFQVGYQRRFDPLHVKVKEALESGEVGSIVLVRSNTRDPLPNQAQWPDLKNSGGIFVDTSSHDYDLVRWLCGSEVSRVQAEGSPRSQPDQHTVVTNLSMANGVLAQVEASRMSSYGYDVRVEVLGTKGVLFTRPDAPTGMRVVKGSHESIASYSWYADRFKEAYRLEMESFVDCIVKDAEPKVTAQDGKAAVEVATAARKSMQEGKAVNLPL
ncbi:MAG: Gfo/Idh/MocA family oxidoreductase [Thaumarchaeota archaeon]|nr:Gfo/Idh/MocA family oxidoreductase [Nitrososphaerota archaeon]